MSTIITSSSSRRPRRYLVSEVFPVEKVVLTCPYVFAVDLESEMYQLSHILQEQRNTLALLHDESLTDEQRNQIAEQESCK